MRSPRASCVCHHERNAHGHYRKGTDCSFCPCEHFRNARLVAWRDGLVIAFRAGFARH